MRSSILIATISSVLVTVAAACAQDATKPDGLKALDNFVGAWSTEVTDKPAKWLPDGGKRSFKESTMRTLKDRFIVGKEVHQPSGEKTLWLMTYDSKSNSYPFWIFNNKGLYGGEWRSTWDEPKKTLTGKAIDMPQGWTSGGKNHFPDKNTCLASYWMKDETGTLLFSADAKKARQPDRDGEKVLAEWSKIEKSAAPLPPELKVLERLAGSWDVAGLARQPHGRRTKCEPRVR